MCLIAYIPANIDVPWDGLDNGATFNSDGSGYAIASKRYGLEVYKNMDWDITAINLAAARDKHGPDSLVLVHHRFGTHGVKSDFNVHPFYVGDDEQTVMAHNGVLPSEWHPAMGDRRSDTRVFADRVASGFVDHGVPSRRGGKTLGSLIGGGNKLVFLTAKDGNPKVRIVNAHLGTFAGGVWWSNDGYLPNTWGYSGGLVGWGDEGWAPSGTKWSGNGKYTTSYTKVGGSGKDDCDWCGAWGSIDVASNQCVACEVCLDCHEWIGDCDCYLTREELEAKEARFDAQNRGKEVELWTPTGSPLNPAFKPATV